MSLLPLRGCCAAEVRYRMHAGGRPSLSGHSVEAAPIVRTATAVGVLTKRFAFLERRSTCMNERALSLAG